MEQHRVKEAESHRVKEALPDIELVSANLHQAWVEDRTAEGFASLKADSGEELMVPYGMLSEREKEKDRATVRAVYAAAVAAHDQAAEERPEPTPTAKRDEKRDEAKWSA